MRSHAKLIGLVAVVAIAAGVAVGAWHRADAPRASFVALNGNNFTVADLRGKVVLVNFWATSCVTCVAEMPKLVEAWRQYAPRGYETVAVAMASKVLVRTSSLLASSSSWSRRALLMAIAT